MEIIAEAAAESQLDHFESHFRHDGFFLQYRINARLKTSY